MLIDTHAHVNFRAFKDDWREVLDRSLQDGTWVINVGSNLATSKQAVEIAEKFEKGVYAIIGLHPIHATPREVDTEELEGERGFISHGEDFSKSDFIELAASPKAVAIGEAGVDLYRTENIAGLAEAEFKQRQLEIFKQQIELSLELKKPLVIHCRKGYADILEILGEYKRKNPALRGVNHFFSGRLSEANALFDLGFLISFTGVITFARDYDKVIKAAPLDKLMVETDAPYVAPQPFRGHRNEPLYVKYVAQAIAQVKGSNIDEVARQTTANARDLFGI